MQPNQNSYQTPAAVSEVTLQQQQVLRNTYLLLALSLIPTGIGALIGVNLNFGFMRASPIVSSIVLLAVIYGMFFAIEKNRDSGLGVALLLGLTLFLGVLLGPSTTAVGLSVAWRFIAARSRRAAVTDVTARAAITRNAPTKK